MKHKTKNNILACTILCGVAVALGASIYITIPSTRNPRMSDKEIFTSMYDKAQAGEIPLGAEAAESPKKAEPFVEFLQTFIDSHSDIHDVVDMGCGYGELLKDIRWPQTTRYVGLDIVDCIVEYNTKHYIRKNVAFGGVNSLEDLAFYRGDLLILKDVIQYWSNKEILFAKEHIIPHFKYAIIVSDTKMGEGSQINTEINTGQHRPVDLTIAPFLMEPDNVEDYVVNDQMKRVYIFVNYSTNLQSQSTEKVQ